MGEGNMRKYLDSIAKVVGAGCLAASLAASPALSADNLKVTLNWLPDNSSIGIIYADALGYYKDAGIDLEIEPGKGSGVTSQLVAAGSTDVGLANGPSAIGVAAKGAPIKIIAPIYQTSELGIISLEDTPISGPKDLEGKTIFMAPGASVIPLFDAVVKVNGLDKSKINIFSGSGSAVLGLLAEKKVDAALEAPSALMMPLEKQGIKTKIMFFRDVGVNVVGMSLIAQDQKIQKNPDLYKRFVDATLRGLAATVKNPEAAVDALRSRYPDAQEKSELMEELTKYIIPTICAKGATGLGKAPADLWASTGEVLTQSLGSLGDGGIESKYTDAVLPAQLPPCP
ncbi:ABC transporter substrate-binding protein [Mesorhizobium sp. M0809]|uniref:ABC transporter substrate-binding protein n=1 Tax=Mesorhizobium sp. M0809 TaxID=2957003 RepID=UPI00333514BD